jgi:hypothetical protein
MDIAVWGVIFCPGRFQAWQLRKHSPSVGLAISEEEERLEELTQSKLWYNTRFLDCPLCFRKQMILFFCTFC